MSWLQATFKKQKQGPHETPNMNNIIAKHHWVRLWTPPTLECFYKFCKQHHELLGSQTSTLRKSLWCVLQAWKALWWGVLLTRKTHLQHHKKQKIKMTLKKNQSNPRARKEQWTKHKLFYTTQTYLLMRLGVMLP